MERQEIEDQIMAFLERSFPHQGSELSTTTDLLNSWFVDSLGVIMTVMFLEEAFDIDVNGSDVKHENFHCVETITSFVANRMAGKTCSSS